MRDKMSAKPSFNFKPVTKAFKVRGGARRQAPGVKLYKSGRFICNVCAAEQIQDLIVMSGLTYHVAAMQFHADEKAGVVAGYIVQPGTPGAQAIYRGKDDTVTCHMGAVFEKHPLLRPVSKCSAVSTRVENGEQPPYLLFALSVANAKRKKSTPSADQQPPQ